MMKMMFADDVPQAGSGEYYNKMQDSMVQMVWPYEKKGRNPCWEKNDGAGSARKERKRKA